MENGHHLQSILLFLMVFLKLSETKKWETQKACRISDPKSTQWDQYKKILVKHLRRQYAK